MCRKAMQIPGQNAKCLKNMIQVMIRIDFEYDVLIIIIWK